MQENNIVLVVDDDPGMLKAVQRLLRQHAYEPILFSSAQAFRNHSDIEKAACVILDINLPDGSGIELREDLKAAGVSVPVIYITGNANPKVREAAAGLWMRGVSHQAILSAGADRAAQERIRREDHRHHSHTLVIRAPVLRDRLAPTGQHHADVKSLNLHGHVLRPPIRVHSLPWPTAVGSSATRGGRYWPPTSRGKSR